MFWYYWCFDLHLYVVILMNAHATWQLRPLFLMTSAAFMWDLWRQVFTDCSEPYNLQLCNLKIAFCQIVILIWKQVIVQPYSILIGRLSADHLSRNCVVFLWVKSCWIFKMVGKKLSAKDLFSWLEVCLLIFLLSCVNPCSVRHD